MKAPDRWPTAAVYCDRQGSWRRLQYRFRKLQECRWRFHLSGHEGQFRCRYYRGRCETVGKVGYIERRNAGEPGAYEAVQQERVARFSEGRASRFQRAPEMLDGADAAEHTARNAKPATWIVDDLHVQRRVAFHGQTSDLAVHPDVIALGRGKREKRVCADPAFELQLQQDRKSTRLNSS